ncbi:putative membrane protein [Escherichia coli 1-392-07_S4_C1]|uniref:Putative membrane protein n=1 Tax=Escherichia coli 2-460-02_S1_C1 TaxID=1444044 RepID=A0A836N7X0_ECOLX|nr:putative membrane protein [Escherichia coli 3-267-03_S1_C1]KEJ42796.1 putative membrane protein [Escherichia coli 2-427-07_S4_C3]KEJ55431.1 putative membrane protein [Escherichia coli 3-267-03_S4_C1]KEN13353.1 putative membrane protein [Escherichia coli 6-537-08_S3_C2]KEN94744.1 putative membrane protein [Escherichia coli 1-392-07_S4_C1]KEO24691.1 putative membrane protein [Escherichia coli 2-460-02_S1_C1]
MVQRYGEDSAFHYHSSDSIILIINMLMITFIPDCVVWQK